MITPAKTPEPRFYALSDSLELGRATAREAGIELAALEEQTFESGEFKIRPLTSVRDRPAYVLQTLAGSPTRSIADCFLRLLFFLHGLRDAGANPCVAIIPYLAYAREDRRTEPRDPINTRYVAQLLEASGAARVLVLDVHNSSALDNAFRIKVDHLTAIPTMADHVATRFGAGDLVVVSPDVGGIPRAQLFHEVLEERLGRPVKMAFVEKRRKSGEASTGRLVGDANGRHVVIVDDICATGATLIHAAERCREAGAKDVHVAVTHTPCPAGLKAVLTSSAVTGVAATDSAGLKFELTPAEQAKLFTLPVAALLGTAIHRLLTGESIVPLLTRWPLAPGS
jgi:ribose-phosphate pyrophosphokinase